MPLPPDHPRRPLRFALLLAAMTVFAGCVCIFRPKPAVTPTPTVLEPSAAPPSEVVRSGRYTLVELVPEGAQRELLQQIIDVSVPATLSPTVGEALRHVLLRSGYQLCGDDQVRSLDALPLPAAHLHLGPLTLRDALQILAGPAWQLTVDEAARQVCFERRADVRPAPSPSVHIFPLDDSIEVAMPRLPDTAEDQP